jgi:hypothetical protein
LFGKGLNRDLKLNTGDGGLKILLDQKPKHFFPRSKFGLVLAAVYLVLAIGIAWTDRYDPATGFFISTQGLATVAVTFPAAYFLSTCVPPLSFDQLGFFDTPYSPRTIFTIGLSIAICALLVYLLGSALGAFAKALFGKNPR